MFIVNTRLTIDVGDPRLLGLVKLEASQKRMKIREVVVDALRSYFSDKREGRALLKLADKAFDEWDNPKDSRYDSL